MALNKIVLGMVVLALLIMSAVPVCGQSDFGSDEVLKKGFNFYAVYDRLVDTDSLNAHISHAAMSGDGNRLIFCGEHTTTHDIVLYTVNADGTGLTSIPLPAEVTGIIDVTIDYDGSRAFFFDRFHIYKVEGSTATQILAANDFPEINECKIIQTTADGEYVYFQEHRDDLWKVRHSGGTPEKVIEDTEVIHEDSHGQEGFAVWNFAISADASTIVFDLAGWSGTFKHDLFVWHDGEYRQLTNDKDNHDFMDISGDGTTIVFCALVPQNKWYSIQSDGTDKVELADFGSNFGGVSLTYDGTRMFYKDGGANGGRLVNTDGSGSYDIFPGYDVNRIAIVATWGSCISDDGSRVSFRFGYSSWPFKDALYVGYLNNPNAVPDAPIIHNIVFDPPAMPRGDPDARIVLTSKISDSQGLADIERTTDPQELMDGRLEGDTRNIPVYFLYNFAANDKGDWPDETAGDGVFSSEGKPGGKIDELDKMTVRMGVMDASKTVVVADTVLSIGGVIPTPTPARTPTPTKTPIPTITPGPTITPPEFSALIFESRSKSSGSTIQIPLTLKGVEEDIGNMDITLSYDPSVLEVTEVIKGGLTANSVFDYNILGKGTIKMSLSMAGRQGFSGDGSIAYIVFDVIGSEGSDSQLEIVRLSANRAEDMTPMDIPTQDGVFLVSGVEECRGDCNGDGEITPVDALCALRMAVEKIPEDLVMDMNGDGRVTSLDARKILRIAARLEALR